MAAYGLDISVDWGSVMGNWVEGNWALSDLQKFREAVLDFAGKFANSSAEFFRSSVLAGYCVPIVRYNAAELGECQIATDNISGRLIGMKMLLGNTMFNQSAGYNWLLAKVGIAHELAHLWDYAHGQRLSNGLHRYANGEPAPTRHGDRAGSGEEWAESVAAFVYPDYTSKWLVSPAYTYRKEELAWAQKYPAYTLPGLAPRHKTFVNLAVNGMENLAR